MTPPSNSDRNRSYKLQRCSDCYYRTAGFAFINHDGTCEILEGWGNSRESLTEVVGMMIPDTTSSVAYIDRGFIISYNEIGHVVDDKMPNYNFDKLLNNIQSSLQDNTTVNWAWTPEYDVRKHYMSLPLLYIDQNQDTVFNHRQMIFGKNGLITIEPIASLSNLQWINDQDDLIADAIDYLPSARYSDYTEPLNKAAFLSVNSFLFGRPNPAYSGYVNARVPKT